MTTNSAIQALSQMLLTATASLAPPMGGVVLAQPREAAEIAMTTIESWQAETSEALGRLHAEAPPARLMRPNGAIVRVLFWIGQDGKAERMTLADGEGNWSARRAALYAVRKLDTLSRIPLADPLKVRLIANIVFYRTQTERERLVERLRVWEQARQASGSPERHYLAIGNQ